MFGSKKNWSKVNTRRRIDDRGMRKYFMTNFLLQGVPKKLSIMALFFLT